MNQFIFKLNSFENTLNLLRFLQENIYNFDDFLYCIENSQKLVLISKNEEKNNIALSENIKNLNFNSSNLDVQKVVNLDFNDNFSSLGSYKNSQTSLNSNESSLNSQFNKQLEHLPSYSIKKEENYSNSNLNQIIHLGLYKSNYGCYESSSINSFCSDCCVCNLLLNTFKRFTNESTNSISFKQNITFTKKIKNNTNSIISNNQLNSFNLFDNGSNNEKISSLGNTNQDIFNKKEYYPRQIKEKNSIFPQNDYSVENQVKTLNLNKTFDSLSNKEELISKPIEQSNKKNTSNHLILDNSLNFRIMDNSIFSENSSPYLYKYSLKECNDTTKVSDTINDRGFKTVFDGFKSTQIYSKNSILQTTNGFSSYSCNVGLSIIKEQTSVLELLELHKKYKNRAINTIKLYERAIRCFFTEDELNIGINKIDWVQKRKDFYAFDETVKQIKRSTYYLYVNCVKTLFRWGNAHQHIDNDYLYSFILDYKSITNIEHRPALKCESFMTMVEAMKRYRAFMHAMIKFNEKENNENFIILWVIHSILCTRRIETIRVIQNYKHGDKHVTIKTKCYDSFEVPIVDNVAILIEKIQPWIKKLKERTASEYVLRCIPPKYQKEICAHGVRAFFRTVIEFLNLKNIDSEVKEMYICHLSKKSVYSAYMRNNFLEKRMLLQKEWSSWLLKTVPRKTRTTIFNGVTFETKK